MILLTTKSDHTSSQGKFIPQHHPCCNFISWIQEARQAQIEDYNAMSLATVDGDCCPDVRMLYLREITDDYGLIFYTSSHGSKFKHIQHKPNVAMCFYWHKLQKQVRIKGTVTALPHLHTVQYFHSRPRGSQISAWVSRQSQPMDGGKSLQIDWKKYNEKFRAQIIPKPRHWIGFLIDAHYFEFWMQGAHRLHNRHICQLVQEKWKWSRIQP